MADLLDAADLAELAADQAGNEPGVFAGRLTDTINRATDAEALRRVWRIARDLPDAEQRVIRTYAVVKHDILAGAS